jgi:DNA (cytosine-5)-methyltransferase 1
MSWLFSQALVEEYLGDICLDGEQSVLLSGKPIQQAYCAPDKMTDFLKVSQSGMMFKPLTENLGEELLMLFLGDFHAKTLAQQELGGGITGSRSSMWKHMARIIGEVQPRYCFVENSPMLTTRGLGTVLGDLASLGFDAEWGVLSAADVGANHLRERIWILGKNTKQPRLFPYAKYNRDGWREQQSQSIKKEDGTMANSRCELRSKRDSTKLDAKKKIRSSSPIHNKPSGEGQFCNSNSKNVEKQWKESFGIEQKLGNFGSSSWWETEPNVGRVANGVAFGMDKLKAIGNGQVPFCAATAWRLLNERI